MLRFFALLAMIETMTLINTLEQMLIIFDSFFLETQHSEKQGHTPQKGGTEMITVTMWDKPVDKFTMYVRLVKYISMCQEIGCTFLPEESVKLIMKLVGITRFTVLGNSVNWPGMVKVMFYTNKKTGLAS